MAWRYKVLQDTIADIHSSSAYALFQGVEHLVRQITHKSLTQLKCLQH